MVIDDSSRQSADSPGVCNGFDYYDTAFDNMDLINKSKKIINLRLKNSTHYCIKLGVYLSKNQVSENVCNKSYPDMDYSDAPDSNIMKKILIDKKSFIYLKGEDGTAGTAYGASIYRGIINKKCLLIDVYYKQPDPFMCSSSDKAAQKIMDEFSKDDDAVNEIVHNIEFNWLVHLPRPKGT